MLFMHSKETNTGDKKEILRHDLRTLEKMIRENEAVFNMTESEELINFTIYQNIALNSKYNYLLQCFKQLE
ncbi:MAG: hypothetical protein RR315_02590 [Oscillospiraceae bacterium]